MLISHEEQDKYSRSSYRDVGAEEKAVGEEQTLMTAAMPAGKSDQKPDFCEEPDVK